AALGEPPLGDRQHLADRRVCARRGGEVPDEADVFATTALPATIDQRDTARDLAAVGRDEQRVLRLLPERRAPGEPLFDPGVDLCHEHRIAADELALQADEPLPPALVLRCYLLHPRLGP